MRTRNVIAILIGSTALLLVPLVAMQLTDEVVWGPIDFIVAWVLLSGTGLAYELVAQRSGQVTYRVAAGLALAAALLLVWMSLAVGILGVEGDPADLMYLGVLAVGFFGAILARFQAYGMARALLATATAQALVAVIALMLGKHQAEYSSVAEIVLLNAFFVALFAGSASLFREAAMRQPEPPAGA